MKSFTKFKILLEECNMQENVYNSLFEVASEIKNKNLKKGCFSCSFPRQYGTYLIAKSKQYSYVLNKGLVLLSEDKHIKMPRRNRYKEGNNMFEFNLDENTININLQMYRNVLLNDTVDALSEYFLDEVLCQGLGSQVDRYIFNNIKDSILKYDLNGGVNYSTLMDVVYSVPHDICINGVEWYISRNILKECLKIIGLDNHFIFKRDVLGNKLLKYPANILNEPNIIVFGDLSSVMVAIDTEFKLNIEYDCQYISSHIHVYLDSKIKENECLVSVNLK